MAFSILTSASAVSSNGTTVTSAGIDTTGADLLIVHVADSSDGAASTLVDSKGNTWSPLTRASTAGYSASRLHYCISPIVGSGHTFSLSGGIAPALSVLVVNCGGRVPSYDTSNGASANSTSIPTGSITPSMDGELIVAGVAQANEGGSPSINLGFTIATFNDGTAGSAWGTAFAYLIQGAKSSVNPTWTMPNSFGQSATIATFSLPANPFTFARSNSLRPKIFTPGHAR